MIFIRLIMLSVCAILGYSTATYVSEQVNFHLMGAGAGIGLGVVILYLEHELTNIRGKLLIGALVGLIIGILLSHILFYLLFSIFNYEIEIAPALMLFTYTISGYLGMSIGLKQIEKLKIVSVLNLFNKDKNRENPKILDTSVIIDGRIADICESAFIEGDVIVPQFILKELQQIADSSDSLKRNRGRRGLDVLQRMQKNVDISIRIVDDDFPRIKDVDAKLVALCQKIGGKIITNDFNLNKVAELQGVEVLNINQLANAVKPVVLPGEVMNVFILKEGKEYGQGIGYLDDGTMVVVDNARKEIGKNIEVSVTSVLQTTAGRMIFTRLKDDIINEIHV